MCRHIDLVDADPSALAAALLSPSVEETMAIQGSTYWAPRFERTPLTCKEVNLKPDATYLITGGAGGLGLEIASWMVKCGARHIVLTGRRAISDVRIEIPGVQYSQVDVTDGEATKALIDHITATMPPLRGIVHAAAVVENARIQDTTPELLGKVLAPKAAGAVNLHIHTSSASLDFFVLCSSIAASLPQPAHGPYSAANAFLDSFAAYRRALGLPATSIQWGMWSETGLAKEEGAQRSNADYIERGVQPLSTDMALGILGLALHSPVPVLFAAPVIWSKLKQLWPDPPRIFCGLTGAEPAATPEIAPQVKFADRQAVQNHVRQQVAAVLKMPPGNIDVRKPLGTLGLDSLLGLELVRR
jgi:myxalamid-type polyketide synthase MxaE and MxaD